MNPIALADRASGEPAPLAPDVLIDVAYAARTAPVILSAISCYLARHAESLDTDEASRLIGAAPSDDRGALVRALDGTVRQGPEALTALRAVVGSKDRGWIGELILERVAGSS